MLNYPEQKIKKFYEIKWKKNFLFLFITFFPNGKYARIHGRAIGDLISLKIKKFEKG